MKNFKFLILVFLIGCGSDSIVELVQTPSSAEDSSLNLSPQENVYVAAAFFTDPVGSVAAVGLNNPHGVQTALSVTDSSDVVIRSFDGKLFVINRGTSTLQAIDPDSFKTLGNYSVGGASNPQDIVVHNNKAYITRLDAHLATGNKNDLWVVNPTNGELITSINLKTFTTNDGERLARAAQMALVGDTLYILLQDLSSDFKATTNGKVVALNTLTDTVMTSIALAGRNPTSIVYQADLNRLFIADTGFFDDSFNNDPATAFGGIERVNPATNTSDGIVIDDLAFGGYLSSLAFVSPTLGVLTVNASTVASFNPSTLNLLSTSLYTSNGGFLPELLVDGNGLLWIPERHANSNGMVLLDPSNGAAQGGPFNVGAFPASMTLLH